MLNQSQDLNNTESLPSNAEIQAATVEIARAEAMVILVNAATLGDGLWGAEALVSLAKDLATACRECVGHEESAAMLHQVFMVLSKHQGANHAA